MKNLAVASALTLALSASFPFGFNAQAADIQDAIQAYHAGDYDTALQIYKEVADSGDPKGQFGMGYMYHYGYGVKKDQAMALNWFQQAADKGDVKARQYLGIMYQKGEGVPKDLVAAHMWYTLFHRDTENVRDRPYTRETLRKMERKMSAEEIDRAKKMAAEWKPQK